MPFPCSWLQHRCAGVLSCIITNNSYANTSTYVLPHGSQHHTLSFQAACSDSQNALVNHSPPSSCGLFTREFFGPVAQGIHGRIVSGSSSLCGSGVRQWAQKSEWHVALPQAFCGWQSRDSLQVALIHIGAEVALHICTHTVVLERHSSWCRAIQVSTAPRSTFHSHAHVSS